MRNVSVGQKIRALRDLHGWSQRELGRRSGVRNQAISDYECERTLPSPETRKRLADAFGISPTELSPIGDPAELQVVS